MTKEKINELDRIKNNFIREIEMEVEFDVTDKIKERLSNQIEQIKKEFILNVPESFGTFSENFEEELNKEAYNLRKMYIESTTKNIKSDLSETADTLLEEAKQGKSVESTQRIDKKINYERKENIEKALQEAFRNGILSLSGKVLFTRDDIDELLRFIRKIVQEHSEAIEKEVFHDTEKEITQDKVAKYAQQLNQALEKEELEWEDEEKGDKKPICPKLTPESQAKFARRTMQIANKAEGVDKDKNKEGKKVHQSVSDLLDLIM